MVLKLLKIVHFLQICANLSKKSKSIKAVYLYPSERPHYTLSENSMFYRSPSNSPRDIEDYNIKIMLIQQKVNEIHQLQTLIYSKL